MAEARGAILDYDVHGLLSIRVEGYLPSRRFPDLSDPMRHFRVPSCASPPDILVSVGGFDPATQGCYRIGRNTFGREDYIYCRGKKGAMVWEADLAGLEWGPTQLRFHASGLSARLLMGQLSIAVFLFLRHLVALHLARRGYLAAHAAAAAKNGQAILFIGGQGTYKTSLLMRLLRSHDGWRPLGDDMVIIGEGRALSFPIFPGLLSFRIARLGQEELHLPHRIAYLLSEVRGKQLGLDIGEEGAPAALVRCCLRPNEPVDVVDVERSEFIRKAVRTLTAEFHTDFGLGHGSFFPRVLEAYKFAFPASNIGVRVESAEEALERSTRSAHCLEVRLPLGSREEELDCAITKVAKRLRRRGLDVFEE